MRLLYYGEHEQGGCGWLALRDGLKAKAFMRPLFVHVRTVHLVIRKFGRIDTSSKFVHLKAQCSLGTQETFCGQTSTFQRQTRNWVPLASVQPQRGTGRSESVRSVPVVVVDFELGSLRRRRCLRVVRFRSGYLRVYVRLIGTFTRSGRSGSPADGARKRG